jgi:subtilisin family serine protease
MRRATSGKDTYSPHVAVQIDKLHNEGITGKGIKIGIVDTGVDYNHPALGACFGKGCVVSYGADLVGDAYDGTNTPVPGPKPYATCQGHGTHVTGIIGALPNPMGFIGAAPGALIGMYRVFGCTGDVGNDVAIAGVTQAFEDGSDIISLSLGGSSGWTEDAFSVVLSRIVDAGVPCAVANGNSGSAGLFLAGTPANGKGVTAVSSVESTLTPYFGTGGLVRPNNSTADQTSFVYANGDYPFPNITLQLWPVTPNVTVDGTYAACSPLNSNAPADLSDKVVLVRHLGQCGYLAGK